jgi:hypothetical protein
VNETLDCVAIVVQKEAIISGTVHIFIRETAEAYTVAFTS